MTQINDSVGKEKIPIASKENIIDARKEVRKLSKELGFGLTDVTRIVTASSELIRNIYLYAGSGHVEYSVIEEDGKVCLELRFIDNGPGISDVDKALEDGYSSSKGLGKGLPGAKRIMDDLEIDTEKGEGTTITVRKWGNNK